MENFMNHDFNIEKIILACLVKSGTGLVAHKNRPNHGLALNLYGEKEYCFSDGKRITVRENDIIYLPKYSDYTITAHINGDCYAINFDVSEDVSFSPFVINAKNYNQICGHFRSANSVWETKKAGYMTKCKAELYSIIYQMQNEYYNEYFPKDKHEIINKAVRYIHETYMSENINIQELAKMCGITPEYFRRIFKSFYGVSPVNYINNMKITRARELLESQMYSVTETAQMSGYSELSYFSREFKRILGICPSEYIKTITNKMGTDNH